MVGFFISLFCQYLIKSPLSAPTVLGFSYLGLVVSLHSCSSKAQPLLLTLDEGYLLTTAPPDLECGVAPLGPPVPVQPPLLGCGVAPLGPHNAMSVQESPAEAWV